MLISDNRKNFYDLIVRSRCHVLVLVNHDLDAIISAKILRYIFECDHIQYTIVPVRTKTELQRAFQEHRVGVKFALLLNLGGILDLSNVLLLEKNIQIFVADYHRPLNVQNVYNEDEIFILCSISGLNNIDDEFEKVPNYNDLFWDSDIEDDDVDVRQLSLQQLEKRKKFKKFENNRLKLLQDYEQKSYYSYSTSMIFFDLAWKMGKDSNDLLWLVILSVMDKYNTNKSPKKMFDKEFSYLSDSMIRLRNIRSDFGFVLNNVSADENQPELVTATNHLSITAEKDLNIKLYREWTLYDSLKHSIYTSCAFKTWKLRGQKRLDSFLAEHGLPLSQCKQKFKSMDLDLRKKLKEDFSQDIVKYNLKNLFIDNFIGSRGIQQKYSAIDLALASRALLESAEDKSYNQKFFDAYDSLSWVNSDLINIGIDLAKAQLSAIVQQVQLIMDAHLTCLMNNNLWYIIIPESTPDINLFSHPGCLRALGIYALTTYVTFNKSSKATRLPLIIITPDPERPNGGMVCGIPPVMALKTCETFFHQLFKTVSRKMYQISEFWSYEDSIIDNDIVYIPYRESYNFINELSMLLESN